MGLHLAMIVRMPLVMSMNVIVFVVPGVIVALACDVGMRMVVGRLAQLA
jgi:hypothetical protein